MFTWILRRVSGKPPSRSTKPPGSKPPILGPPVVPFYPSLRESCSGGPSQTTWIQTTKREALTAIASNRSASAVEFGVNNARGLRLEGLSQAIYVFSCCFGLGREAKSKTSIWGVPLFHFCFNRWLPHPQASSNFVPSRSLIHGGFQ